MNRPTMGWTVLRLCIGIFFLFEGVGKVRWFVDASMLRAQLNGWSQASAATSVSHWYLERLALPYVSVFARLVPLGEISSGLALIANLWTPVFAFVAFLMALNFQIASDAVFRYAFLTSGYGLPVLGSTLALALGLPMTKGRKARP